MDIEKIQASLNAYANGTSKIKERKLIWAKDTFPMIKDTLKQIAESTTDLEFQANADMTNNESAMIFFKNSHSGYKTTHKAYAKIGGLLLFSLSGTGKVRLIIEYPYIEEIGTKPAPYKWKNEIEPYQILEADICEWVKQFIELIAAYETTGDDNVMPFDFTRN